MNFEDVELKVKSYHDEIARIMSVTGQSLQDAAIGYILAKIAELEVRVGTE